MRAITINEALAVRQQLQARHSELVSLRNANSAEETRYFGANADKVIQKKPLYDPMKLDKTINKLSQEMRLLDLAVKVTNAQTNVTGYDFDDAILGQLEA